MTRKGRKSLTLWKECDNCSCIINAKDSEMHLNSCPPSEDNWDHNYIKNKVLFSCCEDYDVKAAPTWMRTEIIEDIIFLSQSAMQICGFVIGFPVLLTISGRKTIKRVWPTSEGSLTSVLLLKEALEVRWDSKLTTNLVTVTQLPYAPKTINEVYYRIANNDEENLNFEEFSLILQNKFKEKIFFIGNKFHIQFYGKKVLIQIEQCKRKESNIVDELNGMSLDDVAFAINDSTSFICSNKNKSNKNIAEVPALKFGGYEAIITDLKQNMALVLEKRSIADSHCIGILIYGIHGTGKTLALKYLSSFFRVNVVNIRGTEMFSKYYGETEAKLRTLFNEAINNTPSIILIDNIEILCPRKASDQERRIVSTVLSFFDSIEHKNIVILATSSKIDNIEPSLRRPGRLELEIELPVPNVKDRILIMEALLPESNLQETIKQIADISHGFVGADLAATVAKAQTKAVISHRSSICKEDLIWAHSQVMPSAMKEVFIQVPNVKWTDIAGQEELKLKLKQCVEWPIKYPESFTRLGIKPPRGVLLFGPPGCSKTMVAKAIATESQLNFLSIKGSDIFSKWVGESERAIRDVFKRARCVAPCIIFIDEVDALGGERETSQVSGGSAVQERVLSQLLTEMDGVMPLENVIVIAATNRPDRMDKALLRPGRLDRIIYVPLPNYDTRRRLFELQFIKMPTESSVKADLLAELTDGYSGAELVAVCNEAALKALEETIEANVVRMDHFHEALKLITPRTPPKLLKLYEDYINKKESVLLP